MSSTDMGRPVAPSAGRSQNDADGSSDYDVVVVGGGAGGVGAAVGAAQSGAKVLLIEQYPFLGGAATISSVLSLCGIFDQRGEKVVAGVADQLLDRLREHGAYREKTMGWTGNRIVLLDAETTKLAYDEVTAAAGVDVRLHSTLIGAERLGDRVTALELHHRGGRETVRAAAFVDGSGDGALLAEAGAEIRVEPVERRQTSSLVCRFGGVTEDADLSREGTRAAVAEYATSGGVQLPRDYGIMVRLPLTGEIMAILVDEQVDALDAEALSRDEAAGRRQSRRYLEALRKHLPGWSGAYLIETGPQMGIRETRHLVGRTSLTAEDVLTSRKQPDESIARCGWPVEDHAGRGVTRYAPLAEQSWYDVPYGAICSSDTDNLWAVGRLTSAQADAYASVRVMGTALATGHAAGVAAAQYASGRPHDLPAIRAELRGQGAIV
ncbi:FAD-dependent oxidoreductase [Streptomyces sp. NBC_00483]|uniref:FAD-dependent oxidoreductase n=1 Tax=Streptomyces sp. NBC_00483 TaxID=2975756 RepID=UPI002E173F11